MAATSPVFAALIAGILYYASWSATLAGGGLALGALPITLTLHEGSPACTPDLHELGMALFFAIASVVASLVAQTSTSWAEMQSKILFGEDIDSHLRRRTPQTAPVKRALVLAKLMLLSSFTTMALTLVFVVQMKSIKIACMGTAARVALYFLVPTPAIVVFPLLLASSRWTFGTGTPAVDQRRQESESSQLLNIRVQG